MARFFVPRATGAKSAGLKAVVMLCVLLFHFL